MSLGSTRGWRLGSVPRRLRSLAVFAVAVGEILLARPASAAPSIPTIVVSRSSGTAPLAVLFDATSTTDTSSPRPFHSLRYEWSFGDPTSGTWSVSNRSKNQALGPVAGHLFERPGVYTVTLTIRNRAGETTTRTTTINVSDPNQAFAPQNTFCYADHTDNPQNWSGCPVTCPGPNCINTSNANQALAGRVAQNTRHLFRRGDRFAQTASLDGSAGPVQIAAFGASTSAKPVLQSDFANNTIPAVAGRSDWSVGQLTFEGADGIGLFAAGGVTERLSVWDVEARGFSQCAVFWGAGAFHRNLAVVDYRCTQLRPTASEGNWIFFDRSEGSMYLGLDIDGANATTTNGLYRTVHSYKSVLQHSRLDTGVAGGALSIRSCGHDQGGGCASGVPNKYLVFSDNRVISGTSIPIRTCTHNVCKDTGTDGTQSEDILWERNFVTVAAPDTNLMNMIFWIEGGDQTIRNNVIDLTGAPSQSNLHVVVSQFGPSDNGVANRNNVHVFNNTVFANGVLRGITLCSNVETGTGHRCRNNLMFAPGAATKVSAAAPWQASNNLRDGIEYTGFPFTTTSVPSPSLVTDFQLAAGATSIDAGFDFTSPTEGYVSEDMCLRSRPSGSHFDVGAYERTSALCDAGGTAPLPDPQVPAAPVLLP